MTRPVRAPTRERQCIVLRGEPDATSREALRLVAAIAAADVLWVGAAPAPGAVTAVAPSAVRRLLGRSFDVVVLDVHTSLDADVVGQCHGFVWGGGALILRMPPVGEPGLTDQDALAAFPYRPADVGLRFRRHFERALPPSSPSSASPLTPVGHEVHGTAEQAALVADLEALLADPTPRVAAVLADRGRGKSSALGMAVGRLVRDCQLRVAVSAGHLDAVVEVLRFAAKEVGDARNDAAERRLRFVPISALVHETAEYDVIIVDEAAQVPVPVLKRLVRRHPAARIAFATTTRGYEGTGRGFVLRFLVWLSRQGRPYEVLRLAESIRWGSDDPVERLIFDALLLNAEPPGVTRDIDLAEVQHVCFDRDRLVTDEATLRGFFGLLIHAHYRTTPSDLHRMLDAPNIRLHALLHRGDVVAATMVAQEGGLPAELCAAMAAGTARIRAHALADTLVAHLGHRDAGGLAMIRSMRIAVHPDLRRLGLATRLISHVHQAYSPDLFGTLFGATAELLAFRRSVDYGLVRVSASHGTRTGEPAVMMIRPVSPRGIALMGELRAELARDLPLQLELLQASGDLLLDADLAVALVEGLPPPASMTDLEAETGAHAYVYGPRTFESASFAVTHFVERHLDALARLSRAERAVVEGRVLARKSWGEATADSGLPNVRLAMRALRRALRSMVTEVAAQNAAKICVQQGVPSASAMPTPT